MKEAASEKVCEMRGHGKGYVPSFAYVNNRPWNSRKKSRKLDQDRSCLFSQTYWGFSA
jgi:hypothetical protein